MRANDMTRTNLEEKNLVHVLALDFPPLALGNKTGYVPPVTNLVPSFRCAPKVDLVILRHYLTGCKAFEEFRRQEQGSRIIIRMSRSPPSTIPSTPAPSVREHEMHPITIWDRGENFRASFNQHPGSSYFPRNSNFPDSRPQNRSATSP